MAAPNGAPVVMDADELNPVGSGAPPFPTKSLAPVRWSTAEGALERRQCCEDIHCRLAVTQPLHGAVAVMAPPHS
jgi:hypothetical protein